MPCNPESGIFTWIWRKLYCFDLIIFSPLYSAYIKARSCLIWIENITLSRFWHLRQREENYLQKDKHQNKKLKKNVSCIPSEHTFFCTLGLKEGAYFEEYKWLGIFKKYPSVPSQEMKKKNPTGCNHKAHISVVKRNCLQCHKGRWCSLMISDERE